MRGKTKKKKQTTKKKITDKYLIERVKELEKENVVLRFLLEEISLLAKGQISSSLIYVAKKAEKIMPKVEKKKGK